MSTAFEGRNYEGKVEGGVLIVRVWRRRDLDSLAGSRCAEELVDDVVRHLEIDVGGLIWDMREAPTSFGPRTQDVIKDGLRTWAKAGRKVAMISNSAMQTLLVQRLLNESTGGHGRLFESVEEARGWLTGTQTQDAASG